MKKNAFTLIELMVTIAIIGLISSIVMMGMQEARAKARDAQRIQEFKQIQKAIELYFVDNDKYPAGEPGGKCIKDTNLASDLAPYLSSLGEEPLLAKGRMCYTYFSDAEGSGYKIMCDLEKNHDLEANDGGCYPGSCGTEYRYELFDIQGTFAKAALSSQYWYGVGPGAAGYALKFEGVDDYVDSSASKVVKSGEDNILSSKRYTLEAWVNLSDSQTGFENVNSICQATGFCEAKGVAIAIGGTTPGVYHAGLAPSPDPNDDPSIMVSWWYLVKNDAIQLSLNQWHFLVATYDGRENKDKKVRLYVDGDTTPVAVEGPYDFISDPDSNVFLGSLANWTNLAEPGIQKPDLGNFKGLIDEVRIYNYAIDEDPTKELVKKHFQHDYSNEKPIIGDPGPVAYWPFEEGGGNTTSDTAGGTTAELKPAGDGPTWQKNE